MFSSLSLAPRYRLDDESTWLQGVDPLRRYWVAVNGDDSYLRWIPGLSTLDVDSFRQAIRGVRALAIGQDLTLPTELGADLTIACVAENAYAIVDLSSAPVWHLFDRESLEALLMTAHPDWQCAPQHVQLGASLLTAAWGQPVVAKVA